MPLYLSQLTLGEPPSESLFGASSDQEERQTQLWILEKVLRRLGEFPAFPEAVLENLIRLFTREVYAICDDYEAETNVLHLTLSIWTTREDYEKLPEIQRKLEKLNQRKNRDEK